MAVGFTPKHMEAITFNDLTQQQFLILAFEAAMKLGWKLGYISNHGLIAYTDHGSFSWNGKITVRIENQVASVRSESTGSDMVDWGKNKRTVKQFITAFGDLENSAVKEDLDAKYQELSAEFALLEEETQTESPLTSSGGVNNFLGVFVPKQDFFVTPILIDANILIFIAMAIAGVSILNPDGQSLLDWGANFRPMTLEGQWWRLLTNCFLHIGILHLLLNMYALLYIGVLLEPILGKARFIAAYLLTGVAASVASLWWHDLTISAGASGAIFGMYGVFLALLTTDLIEKTARKALLTSIGVFVGYNLLFGLQGGIDNAAHLGGLISGLVIGYAFVPGLKQPDNRKLTVGVVAGLTAVVLVASAWVYHALPNDIGVYDAKIEEFSALEQEALEVLALLDSAPKDQVLYELEHHGMDNWRESIRLIENCQELELPADIQRRNQGLIEYCELRLESYELLYKAIEEDTDRYNAELGAYNQKLERKLKELAGG